MRAARRWAAALSGRFNFTLGKQHGGKKMIEHGIAGLADQTIFTELARLVGLARIEGGGSTADDVFGGVLAHVERIISVIPGRREASNPESGDCCARFRVRANARPGMTKA